MSARASTAPTICYADRFIPEGRTANAPRETGDEPNAVPFLKRFIVFNVEQCDGLPGHIVAAPKPVAPSELSLEAETLIAATGAKFVEGGGEAFYHRGEDFIRLPLPRNLPFACRLLLHRAA